MKNWWRRILDFISPRCCVVCDRRLAPTEQSLCSVCLFHLPRTTYQFTPDDNDMAQLFWHITPIRKAAALFFFEPHSELAQIIYQLKYGNRPDIGEDLGRHMASEMQLASYFDDIDALVPVPLAKKRMRQRGYNQSERLAQGISDMTHIPVLTKVLRRIDFKQSQTSLNRQQRQANVNNTFEVTNGNIIRNKHILLIDDICTTGATLASCANTLSSIEGIRISVLTLGLTKS